MILIQFNPLSEAATKRANWVVIGASRVLKNGAINGLEEGEKAKKTNKLQGYKVGVIDLLHSETNVVLAE